MFEGLPLAGIKIRITSESGANVVRTLDDEGQPTLDENGNAAPPLKYNWTGEKYTVSMDDVPSPETPPASES